MTTALLKRNGNFPNNKRFPVIIYHADDLQLSGAKDYEKIFHNGSDWDMNYGDADELDVP